MYSKYYLAILCVYYMSNLNDDWFSIIKSSNFNRTILKYSNISC